MRLETKTAAATFSNGPSGPLYLRLTQVDLPLQCYRWMKAKGRRGKKMRTSSPHELCPARHTQSDGHPDVRVPSIVLFTVLFIGRLQPGDERFSFGADLLIHLAVDVLL